MALTVNTLSTLQNIRVCIKFRYPCAACYFYLNLEQKSRQTTANEMTGAVSSDKLLSEQFLQFKEGVTEVTRSRVQAQSLLKIHALTVLNRDLKALSTKKWRL